MEAKRQDYSSVAQSEKFKTLLADKKRFLLPMTVFFLGFYFMLPVLTSYTTVLNTNAFGSVSWAWVFALAQFIMTWTLCTIYIRKAERFDQTVEEINSERRGERG